MALPRVEIQYQNGGLGLVTRPDDRVVGLVVTGNAAQGLIPGQISRITSMESVKGFAPATYPSFAADYYNQVADFFRAAGEGAELWVLFSDPATPTATLFTNGQIASLLDAADGRLNVVGISRYLVNETGVVTADGLDNDTLAAMANAQALASQYAASHKPVRFILDGRHWTGDSVGIRNLKGHTFNRVAICLGGIRAATPNAAIGLLLGSIAAIPVNRNIGRVKNGEVPTSVAYYTNGAAVTNSASSPASALNDKGYIFLRKHPNRAGFYWNDDHMATADTDDYFSLSNGRTIDKAARIAHATFSNELLDEVLVDERGKIVKTTLKYYQASIERAIGLAMAANGEISLVQAFVDPNQDVLATGQLTIDLRVTPTGTNRVILIKLGLFNPNAA